MKKKLKKRGLSTVVTTVILISISIIVAFIFGSFINNMAQEKSEFITTEGLTLDVQIVNVEIVDDTSMTIKIKRNPGGDEISGVIFVVYDKNNSEVHKRDVSLNELEEKDFEITLEVLNTFHVHKVTVAPIYETSSGRRVVSTNEAEEIISSTSEETSVES